MQNALKMDDRLPNKSYLLRTSVLSGISLFLTLIALFFAIFHFVHQNEYVMAFAECILSVYSCSVYTRIKQKRYSQKYILSYAYYLMFMLLLGTYSQPVTQGLFIWSSFAPMMLYLLLGIRHGMYTSGIFLLIQSVIIAIKFSHNDTYNMLESMFNLVLCYVGIWVVSHLYESNRSDIENSLMYLASRDSLTGTHNRLSLSTAFHRFTSTKKEKQHLSLLILDIDYFKQINDRFGHDIGDKVLIETSLIISRIVGDENLFRIGGEEFCITLFDMDLDEAKKIGEKLRHTVSSHLFSFGDKRLQLTLSIGICRYRNGDNLSDILKLADIELYKAKKNGKNQVRICQTGAKTSTTEEEVEHYESV
ncbi:GGDEF domain-containing protein [Vibrio mangrovi]|uniref:diguanylate cyclase n=1 Tax=Vibrio mangrovi TaxID=474394 RepID=A0A1Y6IMU7_9VIBR|nr:GGDEF domain-containing protein [Vibrio mangrovi]MDW6004217.1 GGDEF domain-containing protein [Vibrio mangrovi]SMR98985.1 Response regulator PleD [Vibrio mangrovi]